MVTDVLDAEGEASVAELVAAGHPAAYRHHDVRELASWNAVAQATLDAFGRMDCLVNNAGTNFVETSESATEAQLRAVLDVNLVGPFLGMQAVTPAMKAQAAAQSSTLRLIRRARWSCRLPSIRRRRRRWRT
jgi:3alpha(or 20beta)-hydroxysteroid dehydrogenase